MTEHSKSCRCVECRRYRGESPGSDSKSPKFEIGCESPMCRFIERADSESMAQEKADDHHEQTGHRTQIRNLEGYDHSGREPEDTGRAKEILREALGEKGDSQ